MFLTCTLFFSGGAAASLEIASGLSLETFDDDVTFQEVPDFGRGKFLCLWDGEKLKGVIAAAHDKHDRNLKSFIKFIEKGMRADGASRIKWSEAVPLGNGPDHVIYRYDIVYRLGGVEQRQIYYIVESDTGYYSVIVSLTDVLAYDVIRTRCDKMLGGAIHKR